MQCPPSSHLKFYLSWYQSGAAIPSGRIKNVMACLQTILRNESQTVGSIHLCCCCLTLNPTYLPTYLPTISFKIKTSYHWYSFTALKKYMLTLLKLKSLIFLLSNINQNFVACWKKIAFVNFNIHINNHTACKEKHLLKLHAYKWRWQNNFFEIYFLY